METVSLNCNNCGAPLEVGPGTNYVTCAHCGARLAVKRTGTSAYTEILEKLDQKTDAIAAQLAEITRQNEVERIDREWERERVRYMVSGKHGHRHLPNEAFAVIAAVGAGLFGCVWIGVAASMGAPLFFLVFGAFVPVAAIGMAIWQVGLARRYREAEVRYRRRRAAAQSGDEEPGWRPPPG